MDIDAASVLYIAGLAVGLWALAVAAIAAFVSWQLSKPAPKVRFKNRLGDAAACLSFLSYCLQSVRYELRKL